MPEARPIQARYVFLDVVDFTKNRSTEAQTEIVSVLNTIVKSAVAALNIPDGDSESTIYLPTGDGICVALINIDPILEPYDIHLRLALRIIEGVQQHNDAPNLRDEVKFKVRIGVNEHADDNLVTDINNNRNIAGAGINMAQRIMSLAEGNQVFVGRAVFETLKHRQKYIAEGTFQLHDLTVKHAGAPGRVYQYVAQAERHTGLDTNPPLESLTKEEAIILHKSATECGMKKIFHSRAEVAQSVLRDIERARERVWISAVGLAEKVKLGDILRSLDNNPRQAELDVKFLLLDALRSTALFRTFLEISREAFLEIIEWDRSKMPSVGEPYFRQTLYNAFQSGYAELRRRHASNLAARFYGHTPSCWLVIIDNTAYFQPYTFGKGKSQGFNNLTLGPLMPVFKFELQDRANTETFSILEDHFKKLWVTSDIDLFHLGARLAHNHDILKRIFTKRKEWFEYVYDVMYKSNGKAPADDQRKHTRRKCESPRPPEIKVTWTAAEGAQLQAKAKIINFSRAGILLELTSEALPPPETVTTLNVTPVTKHAPTEHLMAELLNPSGRHFKVVRVDQHHVALTSHHEQVAPTG